MQFNFTISCKESPTNSVEDFLLERTSLSKSDKWKCIDQPHSSEDNDGDEIESGEEHDTYRLPFSFTHACEEHSYESIEDIEESEREHHIACLIISRVERIGSSDDEECTRNQ